MNPALLSADRRTVLGSFTAGIAFALAGCVGSDDTDDAASDDDDTETADTDAQQPDSTTEFPEGEKCAVCGMVTPEHPEWNSQLVKADGTRVYFCSSGCLLAYYADPEQFDGGDGTIDNVWVTGYETGELIDGQECYYVRITDSDHVDDIMMMNPTPFGERGDAEALIDQLNETFDTGYEHDADIIAFDDFDMELAMKYRGRFFDDGSHD